MPAKKLSPVFALSSDGAAMPTDAQMDAIAEMARARSGHFLEMAKIEARNRGVEQPETDEEVNLLAEIVERKGWLEPEQARLRALFRRMDNLYYAERMTLGGADHWPDDPSATTQGRAHVSVNTHHVYVDIPATLQAVVPVENYVADGVEQEDRDDAGRRERLYFEWKDDVEFELWGHKACTVKELYGFTFGKAFWNPVEKRPEVRIIDTPENLYVGWGNSDFTRMDWAIYCYGLSPQAIEEEFGLRVDEYHKQDGAYPIVRPLTSDHDDPIRTVHPDNLQDMRGGRQRTEYELMQIEVYDYWYKKPKGRGKQPEIWNAIYVGNKLYKNSHHAEYDDLPFEPLPNTYLPGMPYGRPALYDLEQLLREKDERITNAAQMIVSVVGGQMWQITGPEAPDDVPANAIPKPNKVAAPGPGNRLEAITPFMPQFHIEDYLKRLDLELETASGLNELLLGRAPATILGSSKAIAALVANYEARIKMKRDLYYRWRRRMWKMAAKIWERKSKDVREIIDGSYRIDVQAPELTPRDELENAQKAINLVQNRIWSAKRAMDATGVDDPEEETALVQIEQTDPALNPAAVQAQATLLATLTSLGIQPPQGSVNQAQNAARTLNRPAGGTQSLNGPENAGNPPQETLPGNAQPGGNAIAQSMLQGGEASGRILTQTPIGGAPEQEAA